MYTAKVDEEGVAGGGGQRLAAQETLRIVERHLVVRRRPGVVEDLVGGQAQGQASGDSIAISVVASPAGVKSLRRRARGHFLLRPRRGSV